MAFGPADRDGTNQNKDRTWKGPPVKLWVTAPAATFPLSPVHQTGITIINVKLGCAVRTARTTPPHVCAAPSNISPRRPLPAQGVRQFVTTPAKACLHSTALISYLFDSFQSSMAQIY